jgi:WD40 repeat protein
VATLLSDGQVDVWSAATGRHVRGLLPAGKPAQTITYSSDGSKLAVTRPDGSIDVLRSSGGLIHTLRGPTPTALYPGIPNSFLPVRAEFSPNGAWLASTDQAQTGGKYQVSVWNVATGRKVRTLAAGASPLVSLAFDKAGTRLAGGDSSGALVWSFPSGIPIRTVTQGPSSTFGSIGELTGLAGVQVSFSRNGDMLTTFGDQATREWEVQTGQLLFDLPFALGGAATPDAQRIVADAVSGLGVYRCDLCGSLSQLVTVARHQVTRSLTPGERTLYLRQG